jgi:hypothetical protein
MTARKNVNNLIKPNVMKSNIIYFNLSRIFVILFTLLAVSTFGQKPPHLDSLIFLPPNEPIPYEAPDGGIIIDDSKGHYSNYGFESNPALPEHQTKEDIWRNAPIIVEGRAQRGLIREPYDEYPALIVSPKEIYEVYPYALSYVYRGDVKGDTIYILLPRYNYNKVLSPDQNGHGCTREIFGPYYYSIAFLKPIQFNGYTYYTPCNTEYEGFSWNNHSSKFDDSKCINIEYSKENIKSIFSKKGIKFEVNRQIVNKKAIKVEKRTKPKKSDAIPVTGQKIEEYLRDRGWLRPAIVELGIRGSNNFTYVLDSMEVIDDGIGVHSLTFQVYGVAEHNRYFSKALLFLRYNTDVFGDSILAHSKLFINKAPAFYGSNYSMASVDDSEDVFGASLVFTDFLNSLGLLMPAGQKVLLFTVTMDFDQVGCNHKPNLQPAEWDRVNLITTYMTEIGSTIYSYDTVTIAEIPNPELCPFVQITSSFKEVNGKRAGVGDTLEIKGHNFGEKPGYVSFKDANDLPNRYTTGLESQYILQWKDTMIQVLIPSLIKEGYTGDAKGCAGSGLVKVFTAAGDTAVSADTLKIEFAHTNFKYHNKIFPAYLGKLYCINGFIFTLDSSLVGRTDIIAAIEYCLKQWANFTGLRLELEKDNSGNIIFLKEGSDPIFRNYITAKNLGNSTIMLTSSPYTTGDTNPFDIWVRNTITSITINSGLNYWTNPEGDKPDGYYDFIGILLHELGHVLNINHDVQYVHNLKSLMYFGDNTSFVAASDRINLSQWGTEAKNGVQYVIDNSKIQSLNDLSYIKPLFSGNMPELSIAPTIIPSQDTVLCAEQVTSYMLSSNYSSNNKWSTGATTQSITILPSSFPGNQTESSQYYSVKRWNENCTIASNPSLPVKVTWKKYCLRPPGDDKFTDDEISIRSQGRLNASISPNPFSQGIELHLSELNSGTLHITIFAMNGMVVLSKDVPVRENSMKYFLALDGLTSGIYYLQVQNEGRSSSQQLIKIE